VFGNLKLLYQQMILTSDDINLRF